MNKTKGCLIANFATVPFAQLAGSAWTCFATHRMTGSGSSLSVPSA
uniref:Uncharacterized protein n=1 Tax=Klebsiella pneumoniae TaxID=573 RepID=A0A3Q8CI49_KLEPN|nr:hypothetical protein CN886_0082 [Klebsiella pneumoniae]